MTWKNCWEAFGTKSQHIWETFGRELEYLWNSLGMDLEGIWEGFGKIYLNSDGKMTYYRKFIGIFKNFFINGKIRGR